MGSVEDLAKVELQPCDTTSDPVGLEDRWCDLADNATLLASDSHLGRTGRVHARKTVGLVHSDVRERQHLRDCVEDGDRLGGIGVRQSHSQILPLVRKQIALTRRQEHVSDFEQTDIGGSVRLVVGDGLQLPGKQRRPEHGFVRIERIRKGHTVIGEADAGKVAGRQERHGEGLIAADSQQRSADEAALSLVFGEMPGLFALRNRLCDVLVAEHAADFLGDVRFELVRVACDGVPTPGRNRDLKGRAFDGGGETDAGEVPGHVLCGQLGAQQAVDSSDPSSGVRLLGRRAGHIDLTRADRGAGFGDELAEPVHRSIDVVAPVGATPETGGGFAGQVQALDGAGN